MSGKKEEVKRENGDKENEDEKEKERDRQQFLSPDPMEADAASKADFQKKYGFVKKPPAIAQRKISQGGKQYFDSGDYMMHSSQKDRQEIASHPHALNPHLAQLRSKAVIKRSQPSKLTSNSPPNKMASGVPRKSPLAQ